LCTGGIFSGQNFNGWIIVVRANDAWEDTILREIVEGTATAIGEEFFRALVRHLATAINVRYAFVAEFADVNTRVRTLAFWDSEKFVNNFEYDLPGTPCQDVLAGNICHYPEKVAELFPADAGLVRLKAVSFLGVPLIKPNGEVLGHLAAIDTKAMP